jgi:hypothetical protein
VLPKVYLSGCVGKAPSELRLGAQDAGAFVPPHERGRGLAQAPHPQPPDSGERDHPIRTIVMTRRGDQNHAFHHGRGAHDGRGIVTLTGGGWATPERGGRRERSSGASGARRLCPDLHGSRTHGRYRLAVMRWRRGRKCPEMKA